VRRLAGDSPQPVRLLTPHFTMRPWEHHSVLSCEPNGSVCPVALTGHRTRPNEISLGQAGTAQPPASVGADIVAEPPDRRGASALPSEGYRGHRGRSAMPCGCPGFQSPSQISADPFVRGTEFRNCLSSACIRSWRFGTVRRRLPFDPGEIRAPHWYICHGPRCPQRAVPWMATGS